jgi:transcriptional regulator
MYQPPHFREDRIEVQHDLIRAHPLGLFVTSGPGGLMANHVPFLIYSDTGAHGTLRAHIARANPHWREFAAVEQCLVVFQGPQEYVTPSWYPTKQEHGKVVPTWNYVTVQAWGRPRVVEDTAWLRRQIEDLTLLKEGARPAPWKVDDAPLQFVMSQMKAIIGVEVPIDRIEGKWKVSQNRPEGDRRGVVAGLRANSEASAMASLVAERSRSKS